MEPYTYVSLEQGPNKIRLLRLLPGPCDKDIECEILHYTLKPERNHGLYEALSYVWGEAVKPRSLLVKDPRHLRLQSLNITSNLYAALRQMRDPDFHRLLWVDAVCINQGDVHERASQVQIMSLIYACAASVTIWLGDGANDTSEVFDLLRLAARPNYTTDLESRIGDVIVDYTKAFLSLSSRSWFKRIWVLQEVAAARSIFVTCGESELTGPIFVHGMRRLLVHLPYRHSELVERLRSVLRLMDKEVTRISSREILSMESFQGSRASSSLGIASLAELLERFNMHDASDRRDKIYALLGLSHDFSEFPTLWADYNKPWSQLMRDVVAYFLGPIVSIDTWEEEEKAVIVGSGCPLGLLFHKQEGGLTFRSPNFNGIRSFTTQWHPDFPLTDYDDNIQDGDLLCILEGSQYPSIVRRYRDHFLVVKIAITEPPYFNITRTSKTKETFLVSWKEFSQFVTQFPRQFTLIWDWSTNVDHREERCTRLLKDVEATGHTSITTYSRFFHMAQILEDMDDKDNLLLLLERHLPPDMPDWLTRYSVMLRSICDHWTDYNQLKAYVSQLRWSNWLLGSQYTGDPCTGFWLAEGILSVDLFDLLSSAGRTRQIDDRVPHEPERQVWGFGEEGLLPVLNTLAPESTQLASRSPLVQKHASSATLIRQRIFEMISTNKKAQQLHPKAMLDMLDDDSDMFEATKLSLTILSETSGMKAELTTYILQRLRRPKSQPNWGLFTFLLEVSFGDTKSVIAIFEEAQVWSRRGNDEHYKTCSQFLMPCAAILCKYIINTDLCAALVDQWETEARDTPSVLEFPCNTYTLPFKDLVEHSEGALIKSRDFPRSNSAQVNLARTCLLAAIHAVAPWIAQLPGDGDSTDQDTDLVTTMASLQLLWSSRKQPLVPAQDA